MTRCVKILWGLAIAGIFTGLSLRDVRADTYVVRESGSGIVVVEGDLGPQLGATDAAETARAQAAESALAGAIVGSTNPIPSWIAAATNPIPSWIAASTNPIYVSAWDDMLASANTAFRSGASDISTDDALGGQAFAVTATTNAANDHLTFVYQTPHRAKVGGELHPHVHFWQTNADQTNCWYMYYSVSAIGTTNRSEVFVGPASNVVTYTGGTFHQLAVFPTFTNPGISSKIRIKLHRHGSVGTGAITATDFDLHYEVDGFGSDDIASKSY